MLRIIFRYTRENRYTIPLLANILQRDSLSDEVKVMRVSSWEELLNALQGKGKALVCYSFMTPSLERVKQEVERLMPQERPQQLFIAGGPHPTADPEGTLNLGFDVVVRGEGEDALRGLVRAWLDGKDLKGKGLLHEHIARCSIEPYTPTSLGFAPIEITRGCPHGCSFCFTPHLKGGAYRHRSLESIAEFVRLSTSRGKETMRFITPDALSYREKGMEGIGSLRALIHVCRENGAQGISLGAFPSEVRPDSITKEALELIRHECSNKMIIIGAQTGSNRLLARLSRGHSVEDVIRGVELVHGFGLLPYVDMIFGLPGETPQDRKETLRLIELLLNKYKAKIHAHVYIPLPGTPIFRKPPPQLDEGFIQTLKDLHERGVLDGQWQEQMVLQERILRWIDDGLIMA